LTELEFDVVVVEQMRRTTPADRWPGQQPRYVKRVILIHSGIMTLD
jgi:hypothetical protein